MNPLYLLSQNTPIRTLALSLLLTCGWLIGPDAMAQTIETFNSGSGTWIVPAGVGQITVRCWGGGGGSGGHGATTASAGGMGGLTQVAIPTLSIIMNAGGGLQSQGAINNTPTAGGNGGSASGGTTNTLGSNGTTGTVGNTSNGGNGGSSPNGGATQTWSFKCILDNQ
jgi:hypothetical protein